jgi:transcriptional regulator with XRE-family HTH domain
MAKRAKSTRHLTGLYYAREARGMSRTELVERSGVSKQQLSRLENGQIRLRLDHLKPFADVLGYTPEQILLWGRYPGTGSIEEAGKLQSVNSGPGEVPELDTHARRGRHATPAEEERWSFPRSFMAERLHASAARLRVLEVEGDAMAPTIMAGDRVVIDTGHKDPSPDGLYAIRDAFGGIVVRRLQLLRSARPARVKIICDNQSHANEEVAHSQLDIFGKAVCCLKLL